MKFLLPRLWGIPFISLRRKLAVISGLTLLVLCSHQIVLAEESTVMETIPAPVGYWRFGSSIEGVVTLNEVTGNFDAEQFGDAQNVADTPDNNVGLSSTNSTRPNSASMKFDGDDDYVRIQRNADFDIQQELTLAAWVKLADVVPDQKIVGKLKLNFPSGSGYLLGVRNGQLRVEVGDSNAQISTFDGGTIVADTWTHVAMTWKIGGQFSAYVDGQQVASIAAGTLPIGTECSTDNTGGCNVIIGGASWAPTALNANGNIDEVLIFDKELTANQIAQLAKRVTSCGAADSRETLDQALTCYISATTSSASYLVRLTGDILLDQPLVDIYPTVEGNSLTIEGNGHFIDGAGAYQVLRFNYANDVTINNLTIQNGNTGIGAGAAIDFGFRTNIVISDSTFANNSGSSGGAINAGTSTMSDPSSLAITDSNFISNTVSNQGNPFGGVGGAIRGDGTPIKITNSTFSNNRASFDDIDGMPTLDRFFGGGGLGGSIANFGGIITITNSIFTENAVTYSSAAPVDPNDMSPSYSPAGGLGGSIYNQAGTVTTIDSTFRNNVASYQIDAGWGGGQGGAIFNDINLLPQGATPVLNVHNSTFIDNRAISTSSSTNYGGGDGGGIFNWGTFTVYNSTFSNNEAMNSMGGLGGYGGGIYNNGDTTDVVTLIHTTFSGNSASANGGGVSNFNNTMTIRNSIVANSGPGGDCGLGAPTDPTLPGGVVTATNTLFEDAASACGNSSTGINGNILGVDPLLDLLADNGGATPTHALNMASPAIGAADNNVCMAAPINNLDQRGISRDSSCDMGAYEADQKPQVGFSSSELIVNEGDGSVTITVGLSVSTSVPVSVNVVTDITTILTNATPSEDFVALPLTTVVIPAGKTAATLSTAILDDTIDEPDEGFVFVLSLPLNSPVELSSAPPVVEVKIVDNDSTTNNAPVANETLVDVPGSTIPVVLTGFDADSDTLTYTIVTQPSNGTLSGTAPNLTYTPNPGFTGTDSLTFKVNDGKVDSAPATVTIKVANARQRHIYLPVVTR